MAAAAAAAVIAAAAAAVAASPEEPQSPSSSNGDPISFTDEEQRQLWDSVSRSLLKLGKSGLSDTHVNSLKELLAAHKLVKVQLNAAKDDEGVAAAAADIAARVCDTGALIQVRGRYSRCCRM